MFRYHEDGSKKLKACSFISSAWFIFNLNTESYYLQIIHHNIYTLDNIQSSPTPCSLLSPFYLLGEPASLLMVRIPILPGLLTTAPPFTRSVSLSHPTDQVTIFTQMTSTIPAILVRHTNNAFCDQEIIESNAN